METIIGETGVYEKQQNCPHCITGDLQSEESLLTGDDHTCYGKLPVLHCLECGHLEYVDGWDEGIKYSPILGRWYWS